MRPSKAISIFGSSIGLLGALTCTTCLILADNGAIPFLTESYRTYHGQFYVDETCVLDVTEKRGTDISERIDAIDLEKPADNEGYEYKFLGWDTMGNGIPDIPPTKMYYNFRADAIYLKYKLPDFDLSNLDAQKILDFLEKFGITLEDLLQWLDMDMEEFMELLDKFGIEMDDLMPTIFKVSSDKSIASPYFRVTSYGDWNTKKKKWNDADYFDSSTILGRQDIHPLDFVADKLETASSTILGNMKARYTFEYLNNSTPRPTLVYEEPTGDVVDSDAHRNIPEFDNMFTINGYYCAYEKSIVNLLKSTSYSSNEMTALEATYRPYAYDHYLNVPSDYNDIFDNIIRTQGFNLYVQNSQNFDIIDNVYSYLLNFCDYDVDDNINYRVYDKKDDPIRKFYETRKGSATYFANFATLLFRKLGLPARFVKGYLAYDQVGNSDIEVNYSHEWGWTEVYLDGIGWVSMDCNNTYPKVSDTNKSGDISNKIPNQGPGKGGPGTATGEQGSVAEFTGNYTGTIYFKTRSYDTYMQGEWSNSKAYEMAEGDKYNPQSYTFYKADKYFDDVNFKVKYLLDANNGVAPQYSEVFNDNDYSYIGAVKAGESREFTAKILTFDEFIMNLLNSYNPNDDFKKEINNYQYRINRGDFPYYSDPDIGFSTLSGFSNTTTAYSSLIGILCTTEGFYSYANSHTQYETVKHVKDYLQNTENYQYDVNYNYENVTDPLIGFYTTRKGVCVEYATMATLIYRCLGYNARYVLGYATNCVEGKTCYIGSNTAHAWTEVWFDNIGWVSIDCTGFEAGDGTRDSTIEQQNGDDSYGDRPSGGGIQDQPPRMVNLYPNYLELTYTNTAFATSDISEFDLEAIQNNNHFLPVEDFNDYCYTKIYGISASPYEFTPYYYSDIGKKPCYVIYKIFRDGSEVTGLFYDASGNSIVKFKEEGESYAAAEFYDVTILPRYVKVLTDSKSLDKAYLTEDGLSCGTVTIIDGSLRLGDRIVVDERYIPILYDEGSMINDFEIRIFNGDTDVTKYYDIDYEYGELVIYED